MHGFIAASVNLPPAGEALGHRETLALPGVVTVHEPWPFGPPQADEEGNCPQYSEHNQSVQAESSHDNFTNGYDEILIVNKDLARNEINTPSTWIK